MDKKLTIGFVMCGSFCTLEKAINTISDLVKSGYDILPVMSENVYNTDTRFGAASDIIAKVEKITEKKVIHTIGQAEPIGPKGLCDIMVIAPCTGNTLAKLSGGITDTAATMAAKSHLRTCKPVVIALSTNDGLGASAQNFAKLKNSKHFFFVPMKQDDITNKPNSLVADFGMLPQTLKQAMQGKQIQPIFM